jgi:hypothetical protein
LSLDTFERWRNVCPDLTVDRAPPTLEALMRRVSAFWLRDEVILYVGLASSSLPTRLSQYYRTSIGERSPHRGGYFLKLLSNLDRLWVHYALASDPARAESSILARFCANVSDIAKGDLIDPAVPLPFANLDWPGSARQTRKAHGLERASQPHVRSQMSKARPESQTCESGDMASSPPPGDKAAPSFQGERGPYRTQTVTPNDREVGQIRVPKFTKSLFPPSRSNVNVVLRGRYLEDVRWDPGMGADKERSGVLWVGKAILQNLIRDHEVLAVTVLEDGTISIG